MTDSLPQESMTAAPIPANEVERLLALHRYDILDTPPEVAFDRITALAARLFKVPVALVSLLDKSRAWFKSSYGFNQPEVQRDETLCSFALLSDDVLVILDARQDARFACNPFVQTEPGLRFYAGAPLINQAGFNLGTLCLLDNQPRDLFTDEQRATLIDLAAMVVDELELRLAARKVAHIDAALLSMTQGVAATTGEAFFYALVQHFTKALGMDYAYIALIDRNDLEGLRTIAVCANGQIIDNFAYPMRDTPCQAAIQQRKLCCYSTGVQALFPKAPLLQPLNVDSYVAIPFFDSLGAPLGLLGIMDSKPLENVPLAESLLTIFALRVVTELERQQTELARQQLQNDLAHLVEQRTVELSQANERLYSEVVERQQAEIALQQEQEFLKVLLDNVQAGIVACDANGFLTLFNQASRNFHGLPEQPLPPEQWAEHYDLYMPDGKTQMPKQEIPLFRALQGQIVENVEMVIAPKQGEARTLLANGQAIADTQGNPQGAVVVMHDITDRKQAEAKRAELIRAQAARLEAEADQRRSAFLVEVSTALAASLDYEQTLASVADLVVPFFADWCAIDLLHPNQSIERVAVAHHDPAKVKFGWDLQRRYPKPIEALEGVPKVLRTGETEIAAEIPDAALERVAQDAEHLQILRELGLKSYIVSPLIARGQILGAISFVTAESDRRYSQADLALAEDIAHRAAIAIDNARLYEAERIARNDAETANRIKDEFLAVLSHELRSPLNPILGWSKLLRGGKLDATKTAYALETIERNAKLQVQLIEDLLDVSRILRGKLSLNMVPVNLALTIGAALETVQLAAEAKSITIWHEAIAQPPTADSLPLLVLGDAARLQQVIWNLLTNAVKFTPIGGQVEIKLSCVTQPQPLGIATQAQPIQFAQITVSDNGKGIAADFLPHVFEYFRQADGTTTRQFGGLGLGLAIVRHLVELHGGTVQAASAGDGLGATFTVQLPLLQARHEPLKQAADRVSEAPALPLTGIRVLLVDDDDDTRALTAFTLEQSGALVQSTAVAREVLQTFEQSQPDVLISDIGMPELDGYMLIGQIRALPAAKGGQTPAIALTAYAGELNQQQALAAGFQQHISKPVEPEALVKTIVALVGSRAAGSWT